MEPLILTIDCPDGFPALPYCVDTSIVDFFDEAHFLWITLKQCRVDWVRVYRPKQSLRPLVDQGL
jgi:hypothetical protein